MFNGLIDQPIYERQTWRAVGSESFVGSGAHWPAQGQLARIAVLAWAEATWQAHQAAGVDLARLPADHLVCSWTGAAGPRHQDRSAGVVPPRPHVVTGQDAYVSQANGVA